MIRIVSRKAGFRRCGIEHATTPTEYKTDYFTDEQLVQLKAEPMLVVDVLPGAPQGSDAKVKRAAQDVIDAIAAAGTAEEIDKLLEGEERKTVLQAADKRKAELAK